MQVRAAYEASTFVSVMASTSNCESDVMKSAKRFDDSDDINRYSRSGKTDRPETRSQECIGGNGTLICRCAWKEDASWQDVLQELTCLCSITGMCSSGSQEQWKHQEE